MSTAQAPPPPSPGVGARRKGPKAPLPRLNFSPTPNSSASDKFPIPPSPSTVHPTEVIDANVELGPDGALALLGDEPGAKASGAIVVFKATSLDEAKKRIDELQSKSHGVDILAASVQCDLKSDVSSIASATSKPRIHVATTFTGDNADDFKYLAQLLEKGHVVDVDVQVNIGSGEAAWEALEDFVDKASPESHKGSIVLSNILPPPHSLDLPIVKLLTDTSYQRFQNHIASISLYSHIYVKFLPPAWGEPIPEASAKEFSKEAKEWKRRIKMFLGPVVEAFGYQRIIFGTSPALGSQTSSKPTYWYELARSSLAELGLEQEDIDAVFSQNAKNVYSSQ